MTLRGGAYGYQVNPFLKSIKPLITGICGNHFEGVLSEHIYLLNSWALMVNLLSVPPFTNMV